MKNIIFPLEIWKLKYNRTSIYIKMFPYWYSNRFSSSLCTIVSAVSNIIALPKSIKCSTEFKSFPLYMGKESALIIECISKHTHAHMYKHYETFLVVGANHPNLTLFIIVCQANYVVIVFCVC